MKSTGKALLSTIMTAFMIAILSSHLYGQNDQTNFSGNIHFNSGFPSDDMKDRIGNNAYGLGGQIFYSPENSPLALGIEIDWMNYGSETRREPISTTIPDVTVDVNTSNNIFQSFLVLRGLVPTGSIQLYGDALLGFNYMYTETKISDTGFDVFDVVSHTNQDDVAFAYGFGGGVMIPVYNRVIGIDNKGPLQVSIDSGLRYIFGGEAEYLREGSIDHDNGTVSFDTVMSRTDMLKLHVGVAIRF